MEQPESGPNPEQESESLDANALLLSGFTSMSQIIDRLSEPERRQRRYAEAAQDDQYANDLRRALLFYVRDLQKFEVGQLVQWKPLMRNRPFPAERAPAIVVGYLKEPLDYAQTGDVEPLDIQLGYLDDERSFLVSAYSSRRLTAWTD